jgi:Tfp pilus assembly protein FimT
VSTNADAELAMPLLTLGAVSQTLRSSNGFSIVDMVIAMTLIATISAIAIPMFKDFGDAVAIGEAQRAVQSELQQARMKAVATNRIMRVRFNCPAPRQFRTLELIGTPTIPAAQDTAANRCNTTVYPYPASDNNAVTLPNFDGPVRRIDPRVSFGATQTIEFRPTGIAYSVNANGTSTTTLPADGVAITVTKGNSVKTVTVNALGKIATQ